MVLRKNNWFNYNRGLPKHCALCIIWTHSPIKKMKLITSKVEIVPITMDKKSSNWVQNKKAQTIKKSQRVLQFIISRKKINQSIFNKKFWNWNWWWMSTKMWFVRIWMHSIQVIFFKNPKNLNNPFTNLLLDRIYNNIKAQYF